MSEISAKLPGVSCPVCGGTRSGVTDSRPVHNPVNSTRRRRQCENGHRFTTIEAVLVTSRGVTTTNLLDVTGLPKRSIGILRKLVEQLRPAHSGPLTMPALPKVNLRMRGE